MSRVDLAVSLLACCVFFVVADAHKPYGVTPEELNKTEQRPQILPMPVPVEYQSPEVQPAIPSNPENSQVIQEDSLASFVRTRRQAQGEGYANNNFPQRQPYSIGGQRYFIPLPGWPWPGHGGSNTRPKPGNCYRPQFGGSPGSTSFGGGYPIGTSGQQGGNRPTTRPTTQRPRCQYDNQCPGNQKCCSGICSTPSFQG